MASISSPLPTPFSSLKIVQEIAILGCGLVGMFVGLNLHPNHPVHFVGRSQTWKQQLEGQRLSTSKLHSALSTAESDTIDTTIGFESLEATNPPSIIVIAVKRTQLAGCLEGVVQALHESKIKGKLTIVTLMNGVGAGKEALEILKVVDGFEFEVVEGIWGANIVSQISEGAINWHQGSAGACYFQGSDQGQRLANMFTECNLQCQVSEKMLNVQYGKLLLNLNNAVNAISGITLKNELSSSGYRWIWAQCIWEALNVYRLHGISPSWVSLFPSSVLPYVLAYSPRFIIGPVLASQVDDNARSSMFEDISSRRRTEIQFLQGEIMRLAESLQVQVPYCSAIVTLIRGLEDRNEGIHPMSAEDLQAFIDGSLSN